MLPVSLAPGLSDRSLMRIIKRSTPRRRLASSCPRVRAANGAAGPQRDSSSAVQVPSAFTHIAADCEKSLSESFRPAGMSLTNFASATFSSFLKFNCWAIGGKAQKMMDKCSGEKKKNES